MAKSCIICSAFPDHSGTHYSARDVTARLFALRVRPSGDRQWAVLPGCFSAAGRPIMATAHMPEVADAHPVGPCWLWERPADYEETLAGAAEQEVKSEERKAKEPANGEGEPAAQPSAKVVLTPAVQALRETVIREATPTRGSARPPGPEGALLRGSKTAQGEAQIPTQRGASKMATEGTRGTLYWLPSGLEVDIRADTNGAGGGAPTVEALKAALADYQPPEPTRVTLTETLGTGQAWISIAAAPGQQGALLVCTGQIMERLVNSGVYSEVAINA